MTRREDFKTLVADVSMGQVGAVFALEVSRLARSNLDWHRLLELCALTQTVVAWRGRFPVTAMNTNSITEKLLAHAFCAAPSAFVFGVFLERTIKYLKANQRTSKQKQY